MQGPLDAALTPVRQEPLRGMIAAQVRDLIVHGRLAPGDRLTEADLAQHLGTSRVPVREAFQALAAEGWIDLLPRQGARVHEPSLAEVEEVFAVRAALESECARLAIDSLGEGQISRLRRVIEHGHRVASDGDEHEAGVANSEFHRLITEASANQLMMGILGNLELRIRWYFMQVAAVRGTQSWVEHQAILDAIVEGDLDLAAQRSREHTMATLEVFREYYHRTTGSSR